MSKAGAKAVTSFLKIMIPAGKAAPAPPVGPALGQRGVKSVDFCKQFNDRTKNLVQGIPIPTLITIKPDRTFTFVSKAPPTSWLLKKAAGVEKAASRPGEEEVGSVSLKHIYEIALIKKSDPGFQDSDLRQVCACVIGQAKGMGIKVVL
ncbi:mitochondrial ribosomal protein L11 [Polychytrium aggregatum]|uniref:mitochondrial ribosomal protein L11 n=1 Tax=Polychytrium aggregatum TaxID=110093 RepID=UPI0022FDECB7|nr:mitochondrial ribosomal protein L11 [Polychytrium aggregatum]KAI9207547.1 mitochondrial ribosomal protein L11 [Polychytrium aggregatum]